MAEKKNLLTASGAKKLEDELKELKEVRLIEVAQKIKDARAQGDLSENAEFDAAKDEQAAIAARILEIEATLKNSELVSESGDVSRVFVGAKVTVKDVEEDDEFDIVIVGSSEADSMGGKVSNESPLGAALLGAKVGKTVIVDAPAGKLKYKIINIQKQ